MDGRIPVSFLVVSILVVESRNLNEDYDLSEFYRPINDYLDWVFFILF